MCYQFSPEVFNVRNYSRRLCPPRRRLQVRRGRVRQALLLPETSSLTHEGKQHRRTAGTRSWAEAVLKQREIEDQLAGRTAGPSAASVRDIAACVSVFIQDKPTRLPRVEQAAHDSTDWIANFDSNVSARTVLELRPSRAACGLISGFSWDIQEHLKSSALSAPHTENCTALHGGAKFLVHVSPFEPQTTTATSTVAVSY